VLAQERRQESNLALHHADCLMTGMRDEMTTRLRQASREVADAQQTSAKAIFEERQCHHGKACATHKKHAKQLALDQRDFDVVVKNLKQTSMCKSKKAKVVIRKKYQ
jgi:predicted transcriptional regulator